jgi:hypothetical protein
VTPLTVTVIRWPLRPWKVRSTPLAEPGDFQRLAPAVDGDAPYADGHAVGLIADRLVAAWVALLRPEPR